jgi:hypothetical protein
MNRRFSTNHTCLDRILREQLLKYIFDLVTRRYEKVMKEEDMKFDFKVYVYFASVLPYYSQDMNNVYYLISYIQSRFPDTFEYNLYICHIIIFHVIIIIISYEKIRLARKYFKHEYSCELAAQMRRPSC